MREVSNKYFGELLTLQPNHPLLRILKLCYARVRVLPEVEEFFVMLYGSGCVALLFVDLSEHVEMMISIGCAAVCIHS